MPKRRENTGSTSTSLILSPPFRTLAIAAMLLTLLFAAVPRTFANGSEVDQAAPYRDGIVLLAFRDGTLPAQQKAILSSVGAKELKRIGVGVHVVAVKRGHVLAAIQALETHRAIQYAEPDYMQTVSAGSLPNDTLLGFQWAVHNTGQTVNGSSGTSGDDEKSPLAWSITTGTNSVVIAVLDTGVQYSHPDLLTNIWNNPGGIGGCPAGTHGYNVLNSSCDPMDDDNSYSGHGTHVSGIVGAVGNDAAGTVGVNWTTSIMGLKWVSSAGTGATSDLITAMDWVVSAKQSGVNVRVVNDSQTWPGTAFSQSLSNEIDVLGSNDILFITAAGNTSQNNDTTPRYPCSYSRPLMICVAATDQNDQLWGSSNYGPNTVQLAAPGVNIYSTLRTSNYGYITGGSMASPQVAGTAALILSLGYQPVSTVRSMILNGVDVLSSLSGVVGTSGRLNVCKAVPGCSTAVSGMPSNTTLPVVTSLPVQGGLFGASTGVWSGLPTAYAYQWNRCSSGGSNCTAIPGATSQTYALLASADVGSTLAVKITGSNSSGSASAQSSPSAVVTSATSSGSLNSSIVSGTTVSGSVPWTISPSRSEKFVQFYANGVLIQTVMASPYTFNVSTTGLLDTTTLPNGTYVLGARALASDNKTYDFYGETVTVSNPPVNTALPTISGTIVPGQIIATSNGSWNGNAAPTGFSYQWERCDAGGLNCVNISSATGAGYLLSPADTNFTIRSNVTASNSFGSVPAVSAQTIVVPPPPLTITTTSLSGAITNTAYSTTLSAIGGVPPYTWSISSGTLPSGFTLAPGTGVISGSTASTGTINFTVALADSRPVVVTQPLSVTITPPLVVTTSSLPAGTQLSSYSSTLAATGGTPPYVWSITSGTLPNGLTLATGTGAISGISTVAGTSNFTVMATDAHSLASSQPLTISMNGIISGASGIGLVQANSVQGSGVGSLSAAFPISNTAGNLIVAFVRMSSSSQTVSFSDTAGNAYLQAVAQVQSTDGSQSQLFYAKNILGSSANTVTGTFSGTNNHPWVAIYEFKGLSTTNPLDQVSAAQNIGSTPNSGSTPRTSKANELIFGGAGIASTYNGTQTAGSGFTLLETDTATSPGSTEIMLANTTGSFAASFTLNSSPLWSAVVATFAGAGPVVGTTSLPIATQNAAYSATLAVGGGTPPYTWSISSGALPAGLVLDPNAGVISGAPAAIGTSNFTVRVTDSNSLSGTMPLTLTVVPPPLVTSTTLPNGTQNVAYASTLAATGGTTPYTWSIPTGSLPAGLSLAPSTGVISGTPSAATTASFTVQVTDVNSQPATQALTLTVAPPPSVTSTSLPNATKNSPYSTTLAATGGTTPYAWSISTGSLPAGLTLAPSTGLISGTPTTAATTNFTVQVSDANSVKATQPLSLTVVPAPSVTTNSLQNGTQNASYSATLAASGGTTPYTWSISAGNLPAGLSLDPIAGVISGPPTTTGPNTFTVQVTDANSISATKSLSLTVVLPPSVTTISLPNATQSGAYTATLAATGGTTPYTWSISTSSLPAGLSLAPSTGVISGTPTAATTASFTVQVTDVNSQSATQVLSLTVAPPPSVSTTSLPNGTQNNAYSTTLAATGGVTPYTWSISAGSLPAGLSLAPSTGVISGTPTGTATTNFTVRVTDANSVKASQPLSFTAVPAPGITTASLPNGTLNAAYTATLAAIGGTTPYTFSISAGTLPNGLTLASGTGVISGTPTATGVSNFTVQVTDANSISGMKSLSLTVVLPPSVTTSALPNATQNGSYATTLAATAGSTPYTWSISTGSLPAGLSLAPSTGIISGTPTGATTASFIVQVTDVNSQSATQALSLTVAPPPSVSTTSLPNGTQNNAYSTTLAATGGVTPYTWSISAGSLPAGLTLAPSTGVISGTPASATTTNFTVQVTDANSVKATQALSLTMVSAPGVTTASLPNGTLNAAYIATLTGTGGTPPYTWSISAGTLPAGLTLSSSGGVISGTPTSTGPNSFTVQVTDANAISGMKSLNLTVVLAPSVTTSALPNATQNGLYATTLAATAGTTPYTWSISSGSLPAGLSLASSAGVISGTPTAATTASFTVQVTDVNSQSATQALSLTVAPPPSVSTTSLPNGTQNNAYSTTLAATGGVTPYTWSISAGSLPAGLSLAPSTGVISGTPTGTATTNFTVRVTDANSVKASQPLSFTAVPAPGITTASLPNGTLNAAYIATLTATGGTTPYTWSISTGSLPAGLSLAPGTGVISGTPTSTGPNSFTVQVTDANSLTATKALSLTVVLPPSITTNSVPNGGQNITYSASLAASGGTTPYSWSISAGALPAGLTLAPSTGVISGKPTGVGTANFTVQLTDATSQTATQALSITVVPPPLTVTTASLPSGTQNAAYSSTLAAIGGTPPYTWSVSVGSLPNGLVLASGTGAITGTPTAAGTTNFTVQVTDANSVTATQPLSVTVVPPPSVTTATLPNGTQNVAYNATLAATGGTTPYTWSISVGALPSGLTLAPGTGVISGTPSGAGTTNFTVQVSDANSQKATQALSLTVVSAPGITTASLPNGEQNVAYTATVAATGGTPPYTWSIFAGTLPAGLAIAPGTGVISGTPTVSGTSNFTVQVKDSNLLTATKVLSITVVPPPSVTTASLPNGTQNTAYTTTLAATGGATPYTWSITVGALPAGLTLAPGTGVISGTPTATGTNNFTVQVSDANLQTASKALSITINASSGVIALVQQNAAQGSAVKSVSVAFPTANTAGNLLLVFVRMSTTSQTITVADTAGNVYTQAVTQAQTSDGSQVYLFYAKNSLGAANTVTGTFSSTNNHPWLAIYEYKGLNTISPLDQTAHAQGGNNAPSSGATPATTSATELVFAATGLPASFAGTQTAGSGFAFLQNDSSTSPAANESRQTTTTGAVTGTFTLGSSANWSAIVATFKP